MSLLTLIYMLLLYSQLQIVTVSATSNTSAAYKTLCENGLQSFLKVQLAGEQLIPPGQFCVIQNIENVSIAGIGVSPTTVNCTGPRGFAFYNISSLSLSQLRFRNCGDQLSDRVSMWDNSSKYFYIEQSQSVILYISHCSNVVIDRVTIDGQYQGIGIAVFNVLQSVELSEVTIDGSMQDCPLQSTNYSTCSGNGIAIYQYDSRLIESSSFSNVSKIELKDITITNTKSIYDHHLCLNELLGVQKVPLQSSPGITMIFTQKGFQTHVNISASRIANTWGQVGSGVIITFIDTQLQSNVTISDVLLTNNQMCSTDSQCSGNALQVVLHFFDKMVDNYNLLQERNWHAVNVVNTIISNQTDNAAVYVSITEQSPVVVKVVFQNVLFTHCESYDRGVCLLAEALYGYADQGTYLQIELRSVLVQNSSVGYLPLGTKSHNSNAPLSSSLLTFVNVDVVTFFGDASNPCIFSENRGSLITGFTTDFKLQGNLSFVNNCGIIGAAFQLFSFSHMFLVPSLSVVFKDNHDLHGSLIRTSGKSYDNDMCAFQVMVNDSSQVNTAISFTFINNTFASYVNCPIIYAAPLYNCRQAILPSAPADMIHVYRNMFHFVGNSNTTHIISKPEYICLCDYTDDGLHNQLQTCTSTDSYGIRTYPGYKFFVGIRVVDGNNSLVESGFVILPGQHQPASWLLSSSDYREYSVKKRCQKFGYALQGEPGNGSFFLSLPGTRPLVTLDVELLKCPFGFEYKSINNTCLCNSFITSHVNSELATIDPHQIINCTIHSCPSIHIPYGSWIGHVNGSIGFALVCPRDLCNLSRRILKVDSEIGNCSENSLCVTGRTGAFCSQCKKGLSAVFGSGECFKCPNIMLLTILGFAAGGIILVALLYLLNFTLDNGTIGGIIFYANLAAVCMLYHEFYNPSSTWFATAFLSLINLQVGMNLCFYNGMTNIVKTATMFVFPVYLWLIVAGIIVISRYSLWVSKLSKRSPQVLITLIHLSFARVMLTVLNVFSFGKAYIEGKDNPRYIWFTSGTYYGTYPHPILLALAIIAVLGMLLPYLLLVTLGTCLLRFKMIDKLRPYYDTIYAPYKDKFRWWFGARQVMLVALYVIFAAIEGTHERTLLLVFFCVVVAFTSVQAWIKPFKTTAINLLDISYLINMCILLFIGLYFAAHDSIPPVALLSSIFGFVPLTFCLTIVYHLLVAFGLHHRLCRCAMRLQMFWSFYCFACLTTPQHAAHTNRAQYEVIPEDNSRCELRESLLDT